MGSVMNPPRPPAVRSRRPALLLGVLIVIAAAGAYQLIQGLDPSKSFVDRVTIVNPTPYELEVEVSGPDRASTIDLGTVPREQTKTFEDVLDQGDGWTFRFALAHLQGGEITVTRDDLARGEWRVTVPSAVADRLAAAGASPSVRK